MQPPISETPARRWAIALAMLSGILLAPAFAAAGEAKAPLYYDLAFVIEHEGKPLGQPRILVRPGDKARIYLESDDGRAGYRLDVAARPAGTREGRALVDVNGKLYRRDGDGGWAPMSNPRLTVKAGEPASLRVAETGKPGLFVQVTARPLDRKAFEEMRRDWRSAQVH